MPEMTPIQFDKEMIRHFGVRKPRQYLDGLIWSATRKIILDVIKLDELLHQRHGQYEENNMSMSDIIEQEYGINAKRFCESVL